MNLTRLMVLSVLATAGSRHGHQLRRDAEQANVSNWGGVSIGALYRELRSMENEGMIEAVRTEQVGRRPERTVYQITDGGVSELRSLRQQAICELHMGPDAFGVALMFGRDTDPDELRGLLDKRRAMLTATRDALTAESTYLQRQGLVGPLDVAMFHRRRMQLEAELRWQDELESVLAEMAGAPTDTEGESS